jgi:hypothetical protein
MLFGIVVQTIYKDAHYFTLSLFVWLMSQAFLLMDVLFLCQDNLNVHYLLNYIIFMIIILWPLLP